jgi:hypothetical protein
MTAEGVLTSGSGAAWWAWVGVRLTPAPTIEESGAYPDEDESQRRAEAEQAERAWLAGHWSTEHGTRWELRYTGGGAGQPVTCVLLGRVHGRDAAVVATAAQRLRDRLARPPRHVRATPILDRAELRAALEPPRPGPGGAYQIGKPVAWQPCRRRDSRRRLYLAVRPLAPSGLSWEPVWSALARLPARTTLSVHLEPHRPTAELTTRLRALAEEYAHLAGAVSMNPLWQNAPEPFAVDAAPGHAEAARRYTGAVFGLRLSIISAGPVDPVFAELVSATVGGGVAVRTDDRDRDTAWRNLVALNRDRLTETDRQSLPLGAPADELLTRDLADLTEAAAAFRFPYEVAGHPPVFRERTGPGVGGLEEATTEPGRSTGMKRKRVFVSYVKEDLAEVDRLVLELRAAGYDVWIDRRSLLPGRRWQRVITQEIGEGDYFLACFSAAACAKPVSYMREELIVAINRMRRMARDRTWFIPIRLNKCTLPDHEIGPGETVADLHRVDLYPPEDRAGALDMLVAALGPPEVTRNTGVKPAAR